VIDLTGTVVERHVVALAITQHLDVDGIGEVIAHCRRLAASARSARAKRAAQFVRRVAVAGSVPDSKLFARLERDWMPSEAQPGLFDRREQQAFEAAALAGLRLGDDAADAAAARDRASQLAIGRPVLHLVLIARP